MNEDSIDFRDLKWSKAEKEAARRAFDTAYQRECATIAAKVKEMIQAASGPADLWRIHDYLTDQRDRTDKKYDYRYSVLPIVFTHLLAEGWLTEADLQGLREDKMQIIRLLAGLGGQQESPGSDPNHGRPDLAG